MKLLERSTLTGAVNGTTTSTLNILLATINRDFLSNNWTGFGGTLVLNNTDSTVRGIQLSVATGFINAGMVNTTLDVQEASVTAVTNSGGNTLQVGALTGSSAGILGGNSNVAGGVTWQVGAKNLNTTFAGTIVNGLSATSLTKVGSSGTLTLSGANTYTGATTIAANGGILSLDSAGSTTARLAGATAITVNSGGTLLLTNSVLATASNDRINDAATVILAGGTLNMGGFSEGLTGVAGVGALTLTANSFLDFGTTGSSNLIQFSGVGTHTANTVLTISNFEDSATDHLYFTGNASDFTGVFIQADVVFNGIAGYSALQQTGFYEITAVPEPSTWVGAGVITGLAGWSQRRRLQNLVA